MTPSSSTLGDKSQRQYPGSGVTQNYLNFIQSLAIKVKCAPLHHHSDPFELIDRALIIIIILLWLCIKHHRTTCTSGGPQRRVAGDNAGERSHQHSQYSDHLQIFTLHYHGGHSRRRQTIFKEIQWFHPKQKNACSNSMENMLLIQTHPLAMGSTPPRSPPPLTTIIQCEDRRWG